MTLDQGHYCLIYHHLLRYNYDLEAFHEGHLSSATLSHPLVEKQSLKNYTSWWILFLDCATGMNSAHKCPTANVHAEKH